MRQITTTFNGAQPALGDGAKVAQDAPPNCLDWKVASYLLSSNVWVKVIQSSETRSVDVVFYCPIERADVRHPTVSTQCMQKQATELGASFFSYVPDFEWRCKSMLQYRIDERCAGIRR